MPRFMPDAPPFEANLAFGIVAGAAGGLATGLFCPLVLGAFGDDVGLLALTGVVGAIIGAVMGFAVATASYVLARLAGWAGLPERPLGTLTAGVLAATATALLLRDLELIALTLTAWSGVLAAVAAWHGLSVLGEDPATEAS